MVESKGIKGDLHTGHFGNTGLCRIKVLPEFGLNFPTCRVMAGHAAHLLICAMRVLGEQVHRKHQQGKENNRPVQNDYFNVLFKIRLRQAACIQYSPRRGAMFVAFSGSITSGEQSREIIFRLLY